RHDGQYRWFQIAANPVRDETTQLVKWCGLNTDVDERKRAELTRPFHDGSAEPDLRSIVDTIPIIIWSSSVEGYCDFVNKRWLEYVGLPAEELLGWGWIKVIHPDDVEGISAYWQSCVEAGTSGQVETRMRRHDGVYRWFLSLASPLRDQSG